MGRYSDQHVGGLIPSRVYLLSRHSSRTCSNLKGNRLVLFFSRLFLSTWDTWCCQLLWTGLGKRLNDESFYWRETPYLLCYSKVARYFWLLQRVAE